MTRMLVQRHQARIRRVAQALLAKRRLSTEELDRLVGRSVADVKVNTPRLLEMHAQAGSRLATSSRAHGGALTRLHIPRSKRLFEKLI